MRGIIVHKSTPENIQDEAIMLMRNPRAIRMASTTFTGPVHLNVFNGLGGMVLGGRDVP
jgi:hypothetical protein